MKSWRWLPLLALGVLLLNGCATATLWESDRFARFHEPARPVNLRVYQSQSKSDVLVQYDEWRDGNDVPRRRSYWLQKNGEPPKNPHKPRFVSRKRARGLEEIPVYTNAVPDVTSSSGLYATTTTNKVDFTLYYGERKLADYELPVYADFTGRTKQVLLTPLAVTADLTLVGTWVFLEAWASGGLSCIH